MRLSQDPYYAPAVQGYPSSDFRPLGGGPSTTRTIPRSNEPIDARSLGYICGSALSNAQIARREGDAGGKPPSEQRSREQT